MRQNADRSRVRRSIAHRVRFLQHRLPTIHAPPAEWGMRRQPRLRPIWSQRRADVTALCFCGVACVTSWLTGGRACKTAETDRASAFNSLAIGRALLGGPKGQRDRPASHFWTYIGPSITHRSRHHARHHAVLRRRQAADLPATGTLRDLVMCARVIEPVSIHTR